MITVCPFQYFLHFFLKFPIEHENCTLTDDGWIKFPGNPNPIVWIPPSYRKCLWTPGTKCIISSDGYTKLSFRECVYGENWANCIEDFLNEPAGEGLLGRKRRTSAVDAYVNAKKGKRDYGL